MKFVAAYLLAHLGAAGGEEEGTPAPAPGKGDVRRILDAVGAEVEEERMDLLFAQLEGKDVAELLAAGREMLAYAPCGAGSAAATPAAAGAAEAKEEEKKKEEEKVEEEEEDDGGLFGLFD